MRWERIQALFHDAVDLPEPAQRAFLEGQCGDDTGVVADVLALLQEDARGASLIDRDVAQLAHEMLGGALPPSLQAEDFGPYRLRGVLGEGGMGVVYLAERADLHRLVAIKILRDAWLSPARRERFGVEQRLLAQLNHPSIARLYDADTLPDGTPWFVMEYVQGEPLTEYCESRALSVASRLALVRAVGEAVQHAHRHLIIHRDLKPSNVLVRQDGSIRLLDFGIAKHLASAEAPVDQTRTAVRLMTPAYAAPEQIRGEPVGIYTDVYSLGVILYELLVGRLPFDLSNRSPAEAETILVERDPEKPSAAAKRMTTLRGQRFPAVSGSAWADLDVLCLTAMHKDPQRRYRTVEAFIRDIDHYLRGEPLEARPDSMRYRVNKFVRRNWRPLAGATAVFLTVVALVTFYAVRLATARNTAVAQAARTQRIQSFMLSLFQGGDEAAGPAESLRVVTMVDRGVQEAQSLRAEPAVQAALYQTLGGIYQQLGNLAQADSLLRTALDRRRALFGPDGEDVITSLVSLGLLRDAQAEYDTAETVIRDALERARRALPADHPVRTRATAALGRVLEDRGDYNAAIPVLEEAVRLNAAHGGETSPDYRSSLTELANSHFYVGHLDLSDSLNRRMLRIDRQVNGAGHPNVADDLLNLGAIEFERGHFAEAERYDREAVVIVRQWYGNDHPETASSLTLLGRAIVSQGRLAEAQGMLREALAIQERVYGTVHPRVASALNELGRVAQQRGNLDEAEADFRRMADIYRTVYHDKHYYIGIALSNLAGVYDARKDYRRAEQVFRDVLRRYTEVLPPGHQLIGIARVRLGRTLVHAKRYADALSESRAGYDNLSVQSSPPATWLEYARKDLVEEYDALGQSGNAAAIRAELDQAAPKAAETGRSR